MEDTETQKIELAIILGTLGMLLMAITAIVFFIAYQKRVLKGKLLTEKQNSEHNLQMIRKINEVQEKERSRIAQNMHDEVGTLFTTAKILIAQVSDMSDGKIKELALQSKNALNLGMVEIRRTIQSLSPILIKKLGFIKALKELVRLIQGNVSTEIIFMQEGKYVKLSDEAEVALFRVIQELLNNSLKHSEATIIQLLISLDEEKMRLTVADNGCGFNFDLMEKSNGLGLQNIYNRIFLINGKLQYESTIGEGTICNLEIPIKLNCVKSDN